MILGILSDTHNNVPNLLDALEVFREAGVETLIHCGDVTSPSTIAHLDGFRVILTFGNGDYASGEILAELKRLNPENSAGLAFTGAIDGVLIGAAHGDRGDLLYGLISSGHYSYVFRGHSHRSEDRRQGPTRVINPGALGGMHREPRQVCLLDLQTGEARFVKISD